MNINQIKVALPHLFRNNVTALLVGQHGVGKTSGIKQLAEELGVKLESFRLGQVADAGDMTGLPHVDAANDVTRFLKPQWWPTSGKGIIFLDEINRARRDLIQCVFELCEKRTMNGKTLPEGWHVVAAMNPDTEDYTVTDTSDKAFLDRFCHIKVTSSYQDFLDYGGTKKFNPDVLGFISAHPGMLRGATQDFSLNNVEPSDRSWEAVSNLVNDKEIPKEVLNELINGLVGLEAATAFITYKKTAEKPIDGELVLSNYKKVRNKIKSQCDSTKYRPDLINETKQQVLKILKDLPAEEKMEKKSYDNLVAFMKDLPNDLFVDMVKQLFLVPNKVFLDLANEEKQDTEFNAKLDHCLVEIEEKKAKEGTVTEQQDVKV